MRAGTTIALLPGVRSPVRILGCLASLAVALAVTNCTTFNDATVDATADINPGGKDPGSSCTVDDDCKSDRCESGECAVQLPGGRPRTTPGTGTGPECKDHSECQTGCGDDGKCASAPSCTQAHGGRSCGADGNEDCCAVAKQGSYTIDKYMITAGRMRAFIERHDGNIKGFVDQLPSDKWKPEWSDDDVLPTDMATANAALGPYRKKACGQGPNTGHTYWTPSKDGDYSDFDQDTMDEKALNCVPWAMLQALCVFDGGHLATVAELKAAFTNGGTTKYPWGNSNFDVFKPDPEGRLNHEYAYRTDPLKPLPANFRDNGNGDPSEVSNFIAPPGRYPKGYNKAGIADSAGNLLEWVGDQERRFIWKADFEHHAKDAYLVNGGSVWWEASQNIASTCGTTLPGPWIWGTNQLCANAGSSGERDGYYAIGGRCAH